MKKFRGKKRYFRNLRREATLDQYDLDFSQEGWFDLWHTHLDFCGLGNNSSKMRREHIKAHIKLYTNLLKKLHSFEKPYQVWIELNDDDAGSDAVYLHSPNPNENNFPLKIEHVDWDCPVPKFIQDSLNLHAFCVGYRKGETDKYYVIQSKNDKSIVANPLS